MGCIPCITISDQAFQTSQFLSAKWSNYRTPHLQSVSSSKESVDELSRTVGDIKSGADELTRAAGHIMVAVARSVMEASSVVVREFLEPRRVDRHGHDHARTYK